MRLVYVDESYCKVCYYVAALLVPETEVKSLSLALDEVVAKAAGSFPGLGSTAELHGYDMFHGVRDWAPLKPRARIGVYDQALRAIAEHTWGSSFEASCRSGCRSATATRRCIRMRLPCGT